MQSYCLFIVIKHKKTNYQLRFNECVEAAVRQEFLHRNEGIKTTNSKFETTFISQKKLEKQEYMKDKNSFDFNVFSDRLNRILDSLSMTTDYKLVYKDSNYKNEIGLRRKSDYSKASFFVVKYFTAKKDIKIQAKVYYPLSVYSGDFLSIVTLSFMVIGFIIIILITQLRILAKQILLSQTKENLTVFFTHELSSPLQCALTGVEMLESSLKDNDLIEHEKYLKISKEKLLYINCFIDTLLDINKLRNRGVKLDKEFFLISEIIDYQVENCKTTNVFFEVDLGYQVEVYANKVHLSNAIRNLFENAIKYSGDSVDIRVEVRNDRKYSCISVEDNGIGVSLAHQRKIFEQYYRVYDGSHRSKCKGFGLGLTYVKWVAEAHGGKVGIESTEGVGSIFSIYIKNNTSLLLETA